ncbi:MAG: AMP-binding protein [Desulfosarcina sp.]|nr:AMP-binding protein [Desulfosarcina sp.]
MNLPNHHNKNPEATAAAIVNGWLLTGEAARQDEDGFIWLVDRKKNPQPVIGAGFFNL